MPRHRPAATPGGGAQCRAAARVRGRLERQLLASGIRVAGVDEVGRGCLAGPVYAGCAILDFARLKRLKPAVRQLLRDSKQPTP